jgi:hypothetical protein
MNPYDSLFSALNQTEEIEKADPVVSAFRRRVMVQVLGNPPAPCDEPP